MMYDQSSNLKKRLLFEPKFKIGRSKKTENAAKIKDKSDYIILKNGMIQKFENKLHFIDSYHHSQNQKIHSNKISLNKFNSRKITNSEYLINGINTRYDYQNGYGFGEEPNHQMDMMNFKPIKNMNPPYAFNNMANQKPFSPIKQTKPKNPIKKPMNAFMIYMKDTREKVSKEYTVKESALVNQILAKKWNEMSEEDRKPFFEKAKEAKRLHQEKYASMEVNSNGSNLIEKRPNSTQKDSPLPGIVVQDFSPYLSNQNFGGKRIMQHGRGYYNTSFAPDFRFGAVSNLTHQPKLKNKVKAQCSVDCINTIGISDPDSWCDICKSRRRKLKYAKILKEHDSKKN